MQLAVCRFYRTKHCIYLKIMECCIHSEKGSDPNDKIIQVSAKSGDTILYYAQEWIKTRDEYGRSYAVIASKLVNELVGDDQVFP